MKSLFYTLQCAGLQHVFSCAGDGKFTLEIPPDSNGQISLFAFCDGQTYKEVFKPL